MDDNGFKELNLQESESFMPLSDVSLEIIGDQDDGAITITYYHELSSYRCMKVSTELRLQSEKNRDFNIV
ncbi:MAG: hypothetical protein ACPGEF_02800 [Endozoicomonas sp.]